MPFQAIFAETRKGVLNFPRTLLPFRAKFPGLWIWTCVLFFFTGIDDSQRAIWDFCDYDFWLYITNEQHDILKGHFFLSLSLSLSLFVYFLQVEENRFSKQNLYLGPTALKKKNRLCLCRKKNCLAPKGLSLAVVYRDFYVWKRAKG